jgi:hypothetical protein
MPIWDSITMELSLTTFLYNKFEKEKVNPEENQVYVDVTL